MLLINHKDNENSIDGWRHVWTTVSCLTFFGGVIYALTASAQVQPWSEKKLTVREQMSFEKRQFLFKT